MIFTPFTWLSEIIGFSLQFACFVKLKEPKSLRFLMLVLCAGNVAAVLTHNLPILYWDTLWLGRMAAMTVFLWTVADVVSMPEKAPAMLRVPIIGILALVVPYWPSNALNGPLAMEEYRFSGLCLALLIVAVHLVFLIPAGRVVTLPLCLLGCLAAEATGSGAVLYFGLAVSRFQMLAWWTGILFLAAYAAHHQDGVRSPLPVSPASSPALLSLTVGCGEYLGESLRLQLPHQLPDGTRVSSGCTPGARNRIA